MAFVAADWTIDRQTGNIRYTGDAHGGGAPSYSTVIDFHRNLQAFADDLTSSGDDELDITDTTPSERSTDNIITLINGYNIDDTAAEHLYDGSIVQTDGDVIYDGILVVGSTVAGTQLQIVQNNAIVTSYWSTGLNADAGQNILLRLCLKVRTAATDIDGKRLRIFARELGDTYDEFLVNGTARGNNVFAISTQGDTNNGTVAGTISGWASITNTEGLRLIDIDNNSATEEYYSEWNKGTQSINDVYERGKWLTRRGTASTLYGMNGDLFRGITHSIAYSGETAGPFTQNEVLTWGTGATLGTGALLALDDDGATGNLYIQHLTGAAPVTALTVAGATASATTGAVSAKTVPKVCFLGSSTGTAIIGAYGIGYEYADVTQNDSFTALDGTPRTPPNNVTFTVSGLISTEDTVIVTNYDAVTLIDYNQFALNTTLNANNITSVVITTTIPSDTPTTGYIRVADNNGFYRRLHYSARTGSTFTIDSTDGQEDFLTVAATAANNVYLEYISKVATATEESFTVVFDANRTLFVRVRDGGGTPIKTFESTGALTSAGGSATAIRTTDL